MTPAAFVATLDMMDEDLAHTIPPAEGPARERVERHIERLTAWLDLPGRGDADSTTPN